MSTVGLITEYNPFHNGHYYHIEQAKQLTGAKHVIVIMSGNYVQRGAPALFPKQERTRMALLNGADLVLELPVTSAVASAEYFAEGAIFTLHELGIVDSICFGSECGDVELLGSLADILLAEPPGYVAELKLLLKKGLSYPLARSQALGRYMSQTPGSFDPVLLEQTLGSPNNILGIEYLKAIKKSQSTIKPYALTRIVSGYHDKQLEHTISSATALRHALLENDDIEALAPQMPASAYAILKAADHRHGPLSENDFSLLLRYQLLQETKDSLQTYADVSEELAARIINYRNHFQNWKQFCSLLKTKELTWSRISRALLHILLQIRSDMISHELPAYIRLLGFRTESVHLLTEIKQNCPLPLLTKLSDASAVLPPAALRQLDHELYTSSVYYSVLADKYGLPCRNEYQMPIVKVSC